MRLMNTNCGYINNQGVFFFLPSCEPRQGQLDFLWYFVEVLHIIQMKIYRNVLIYWNSKVNRTFLVQNEKDKSKLLIILKYFCRFPKFTGSRGKRRPGLYSPTTRVSPVKYYNMQIKEVYFPHQRVHLELMVEAPPPQKKCRVIKDYSEQ